MLVGALVVGAVVWLSVATDFGGLVGAAGWWSLVGLSWPAFIAFGVWRGWGDGPANGY